MYLNEITSKNKGGQPVGPVWFTKQFNKKLRDSVTDSETGVHYEVRILLPVFMYAPFHSHTYILTHTSTHAPTHTYARRHSLIHTYARTHSLTHTHTLTLAHSLTIPDVYYEIKRERFFCVQLLQIYSNANERHQQLSETISISTQVSKAHRRGVRRQGRTCTNSAFVHSKPPSLWFLH